MTNAVRQDTQKDIEKDVYGGLWKALLDGFTAKERAELSRIVEGERRREIAAKQREKGS